MNNLETKFKQTDIGLIPEDWDVNKLSEASEIIMGQSPPSSTYNSEGTGLPFYQGKTDFGNIYPTRRIWCTSPSKISEKNDILISVRAPVGPTNLSFEKSGIGRGLSAIRARVNYYLYLYYYLKKIEKEIEKLGTGSTFKAINKSQLYNINIPLPPLPEQKRIAHVLSKIQQAIETQEQIIKTTQELKKALMQKLFTEGLNGEPQKQTEIGLIPESWEVGKIKDYCDVKSHSFSFSKISSIDSKSTSDIKILAIKVSDMNLPGNEFFLNYSNNEFYLQEKKLAKIKTIPPDSIVFPKRGAAISTNKKRLIKYHTILDPNLIAVIPGSNVDYSFLFCWFQSFDISTLKDDNPIPQLNKKDVDNVSFPLPTKDIQKRIADIIYKIDKSVVQQTIKFNHLKELFRSTLNKLMTGQIRVKDIEFELEGIEKTAEAVKVS